MTTPPAGSVAGPVPVTASARRKQRSWHLFTAWCAATDTPLPAVTLDTLAVHTADLTGAPTTHARHLRAVLAGLADAGHTYRAPRRGDLTPDQALTRLHQEAHTWPGGFAARRDAFILAARDHLHFPPEAIADLRHDDLTIRPGTPLAVTGRPLPTGQTPAACPACHVRSWLATLAAHATAGRGGVAYLTRQPPPAGHLCTTLGALTTHRPDPELPFLPSLDVYAWPGQPLSVRSIYRVDADRHDRDPARGAERTIAAPPMPHRNHPDPDPDPEPSARRPEPAPPRRPPGPSARRVSPDPDGQLEASLDALDDAVRDALARADRLLAGLEH